MGQPERVSLLAVALMAACSFEPGMFVASVLDAADAADVDTDGDGVVDRVDNCASLANPAQRDWDGDAHGDECDHCPHLASASDPDGDRDGVGDACDPRPTAAGDRRAIWIAFYDPSDIAGWITSGGAWAVENGKLVQSATGLALLDSPLQYGDLYFATRVEIVSAANEVGFCSADVPIGQHYYCCGAYYLGDDEARAVSYYTGSPGQVIHSMPFPLSAAGETLDVVGTMTATQSKCTITKAGQFVMTATTRGTPRLGSAAFYTNVPASYHYAFIVAIGS